METIEINGVKYAKNEPVSRAKSSSKMIAMTSLMMGMAGMMGGGGNNYNRPRPNVDIRKEFELIQNKQSNLCRSDRDWVVAVFNRQYTKI